MKLGESIAWLLIAGTISACLDLSPRRYVERGGTKDAAVGNSPDAGDDAATDAATGPSTEECQMCLATSCSGPLDTCNATPKCMPWAMCLSDTNCWGASVADINNVAQCLKDCAMQAGITSQIDPANGPLVSLLLCAQNPTACASTCAPAFAK